MRLGPDILIWRALSRGILGLPATRLRQIVSDVSAIGRSCVRQNAGFGPSAFWRTQLQWTSPCQDLWGLCVERSLEMVVGILGILKAGAAYVPLDPEYPQQRLSFMIEDTNTLLTRW